jgi:Ala-tRNA(Pro) deacylase
VDIPSRLLEFLNTNRVRYMLVHHPEAFTAQELAAIEHVKGRDHAKVVMLKAEDGELLMAVVPADHRVDLDLFAKLSGRKAAVATEPEFKGSFPDCAIGSMPPFGKLYGVKTFVDRSLATGAAMIFEAGTHTDAVRMDYVDYVRLAEPVVGDLAVKLH